MATEITRQKPAAALLKVEEACNLLAQCKRVDEAKAIRDKAEAIKMYLRQQNASRGAQNDAAEIKLRAERRLGELLAVQKATGERADRGEPKSQRLQRATSAPPTLAELGVEKTAAKRWQDIAKVPEARFEEYVRHQREAPDGEITTAGLQRIADGRRTVGAMLQDQENPNERFTPRELIVALHREHSFTVDAASHPDSPAAQVIGKHWTKADDGLEERWRGERVFCNPPFDDVPTWVEKAHQEMNEGGCQLVVMLLPATRTEQPWWHLFVEPFRDGRAAGPVSLTTRFLESRTRFGYPEDPEGEKSGSPPFGCVLLVWRSAAADLPRNTAERRQQIQARLDVVQESITRDVNAIIDAPAEPRKAQRRSLIVDVAEGETEEQAEKRQGGGRG